MGEVVRFPNVAVCRSRPAFVTAIDVRFHITGVERPIIALAWVRDLAHARALHEAPLGAEAFDQLVTRERAVAPRVRVLEPYCTALWAAMPAFTHPELLHIPFWADRLTIALVAAGEFGRALSGAVVVCAGAAAAAPLICATRADPVARAHEATAPVPTRPETSSGWFSGA